MRCKCFDLMSSCVSCLLWQCMVLPDSLHRAQLRPIMHTMALATLAMNLGLLRSASDQVLSFYFDMALTIEHL